MVKRIVFENNNIIAFHRLVNHPNQAGGSKSRAIQRFRDEKFGISKIFQPYPTQTPQAWKFCEIARKCVKLNFRI